MTRSLVQIPRFSLFFRSSGVQIRADIFILNGVRAVFETKNSTVVALASGVSVPAIKAEWHVVRRVCHTNKFIYIIHYICYSNKDTSTVLHQKQQSNSQTSVSVDINNNPRLLSNFTTPLSLDVESSVGCNFVGTANNDKGRDDECYGKEVSKGKIQRWLRKK